MWIEIAIGCVLALLIIKMIRREGYENKEKHIAEIVDWWSRPDAPTYRDYKKNITSPDVIEYKKVKDLLEAGYDIERAVRTALE